MKKIVLGLIFIIGLNQISCTASVQEPPSLIVMIVVDQLRPDLITRYDDLYTGGFRWLIDNGLWFTNTHHEHSLTATGPGHAAIGFGQYPGKVGVLGNSFYDRKLKRKVNCVEDENAKVVGSNNGLARSFSRYDKKGLGDWLKTEYSNSKVISIAGKDRAACMMGGKKPDLAIYYNYHNEFISSDYYTDRLPKWVKDFNLGLQSKSYGDSLWMKSLSDDSYVKYSREDNFYGEEDSYLSEKYSPVFPIGIDNNQDPASVLMRFPWFEREVLSLSKSAIIADSLGMRSNPDMISIGLSAMDWMIHDYGPFSQEVMDACIKLDKYLLDFFNFLDIHLGLENILIVMTADHGGLPLPEHIQEQGGQAGRINKKNMKEALTWIDEECEELYGEKLYHREGANYYLDMKRIKKASLKPENIYQIVDKYLTNVVGIEKVVMKDSILATNDDDKIVRRLKNMINVYETPEIFPIVKPGYLYRGPFGTSHGTPYDYDTHVPLIFAREGFKSKLDDSKRETVDIAPTIAKYLNITIPSYCDGTAIDL